MQTGVFVDDQDKVYADLMGTRGQLELEYMDVEPLTTQALSIRERNPIVVALDYRLDEDVKNVEAGHTYKGSALAQLLRDEAIDNPERDFSLVLVSSEMKLKKLYAPDKTAHDLFDMVYSKEELLADVHKVRIQLLALADAYESLRAEGSSFTVNSTLNANEDDSDWLDSQELQFAFEEAAAPHLIVRIVLRNLIERPGLLIDDNGTCARLGIDPADMDTIRPILMDAGTAYSGILAAGWPRWWTHRVEAFCESIFQTRLSSLTSAERAEILSKTFDLTLHPSQSPWNASTTEIPTFTCSSCNRPTELRHSLAAFDPKSPRYAMRRRICWDCIQTDRYLEGNSPLTVDETDADLVEDISKRARDA